MRKTQRKLSKYLSRRGITISHVAKAANIQYELLRRSLNGDRVLTADDLVAILQCTDITLEDILKE